MLIYMIKSNRVVKKSHENLTLCDSHRIAKKSHENVNLCDKKPQTSEKKSQKCKFM